MDVVVDLSDAFEEAKREVESTIHEIVGPAILREVEQAWPVDTGRSRDAWEWRDGALVNRVDYAEFVKAKGGLATETVLNPILNRAAQQTWRS